MGKVILVVDDSATARISIKNMIQNRSFTVITAENGVDAIAKVSQKKPDLIFLDLSMPVWDGSEVLALLKNNPITQRIPVVILSGKEGLIDRIRAQSLGANDFLIKPCKEDELDRVLRSLNFME